MYSYPSLLRCQVRPLLFICFRLFSFISLLSVTIGIYPVSSDLFIFQHSGIFVYFLLLFTIPSTFFNAGNMFEVLSWHFLYFLQRLASSDMPPHSKHLYCSFTYRRYLTSAVIRQWLSITIYFSRNNTSSTPKLCFVSVKTWSIWPYAFPAEEIQVHAYEYLCLLRYSNGVFFLIIVFGVANFTVLNLLSLLIRVTLVPNCQNENIQR